MATDTDPLHIDRTKAGEAIVARYRDATVPLVADRRKRIPDPRGNGVLLTAGGSLFLLTAAHVLDALADEQIDLMHPGGFIRLRGEVAKNSDTDVAVVRMDPRSTTAAAVDGALTLADFGDWPQGGDDWLTVLGYPPKRIKHLAGRTLEATAQCWTGQNGDPSGYIECGLDPALYIAIRFDTLNALNVDGQRHRTIALNGVSGAGIWRLPDVGSGQSDSVGSLVGIFTEHRDGHLIGVSTGAFLVPMRHQWPAVFWLHER